MSVSVREARQRLSEYIDRADRDDEPTIISKRGMDIAAIVPLHMLHKYEMWEQQQLTKLLDERTAPGRETTSLEDVIAETLARDE